MKYLYRFWREYDRPQLDVSVSTGGEECMWTRAGGGWNKGGRKKGWCENDVVSVNSIRRVRRLLFMPSVLRSPCRCRAQCDFQLRVNCCLINKAVSKIGNFLGSSTTLSQLTVRVYCVITLTDFNWVDIKIYCVLKSPLYKDQTYFIQKRKKTTPVDHNCINKILNHKCCNRHTEMGPSSLLQCAAWETPNA